MFEHAFINASMLQINHLQTLFGANRPFIFKVFQFRFNIFHWPVIIVVVIIIIIIIIIIVVRTKVQIIYGAINYLWLRATWNQYFPVSWLCDNFVSEFSLSSELKSSSMSFVKSFTFLFEILIGFQYYSFNYLLFCNLQKLQ